MLTRSGLDLALGKPGSVGEAYGCVVCGHDAYPGYDVCRHHLLHGVQDLRDLVARLEALCQAERARYARTQAAAVGSGAVPEAA